MQKEIDNLKQQAKEKLKENKKFLDRLKQKPPKKLDVMMQELHTKTFNEVDCLECANCCKTTSPIVTDKDTERISKHLKMKTQAFEEHYLRIDEDGDRVRRDGSTNAQQRGCPHHRREGRAYRKGAEQVAL